MSIGQPSAQPRRPMIRMVARVLAGMSLAALLAGCPASSEDVQPPADELYFPTGLAISPDERYLFVSNANSDLRHESGTLQVIDLDVVEALATAWVEDGIESSGCDADLDLRETLICDDELAIIEDATVRIGNFAGEVVVQELGDGSLRVFTPSRGDPSLVWADFDAAAEELVCSSSGEVNPRCDSSHRLDQLRDDPESLTLAEEPFGIHVNSATGHLFLTHLTTGNVTLATSPPDGSDDPLLVDVKGGFFASGTNGIRGAVGVAARSQNDPNDLVYVTSRAESRVQMLHVEEPGDGGFPLIVPTDFFFLNTVFPAQESRAIAFSGDGSRAFVVNRRPPTMITVDTTLDDAGRPRNEVLNATELCAQASLMAVTNSGDGERVYVSCFRDGQVWVIDPENARLDAVVNAGRGPNAIVASPSRHHIYVANFLEDTIAVIDTTPGSATEHRVVLRVGRPKFREDN